MGRKRKTVNINQLNKGKTYPFDLPKNPITNFTKNDIDMIDALPSILEKIETISSNPRTHLIANKEPTRIETALRIDNSDLKETMVRGKYFRQKGNEVLPEYIFSSKFDISEGIYENRFILTLINKIYTFINFELRHVYSYVLSIKSKYQTMNDFINSTSEIGKQSNISAPTYNRSKVLTKRSFLTMNNSPYLNIFKDLLEARRRLNIIIMKPFYKNVMLLKPLSEDNIHPTNILVEDSTYSPCYNFYLKLNKKITEDRKAIDVDKIAYTNYVIYTLIKNLKKLDFKFKNKVIKIVNGELRLSNLAAYNNVFKLVMNSRKSHIDLTFSLALKNKYFIKTYNLTSKLTNKVSLDLIPNIFDSLTSLLIEKYINKRLKKGYNNAFVVSSFAYTSSDDVIICSPYINRVDKNISNMLKSMMLITEGDKFIYSHLCPVCGSPISIDEDAKHINCPICDSTYTIIPTRVKKNIFDIVWIKRLKSK